jgi:hypothetical protein
MLIATVGGADELFVGSATVNITPDQPVALSGQMRTRIAREVQSEVTATALALETRNEDGVVEQAVFVACDLVAIREGIAEKVRAAVAERVTDLDVQKVILSATHTHTAPVMVPGRYAIDEPDVMLPEDYVVFLVDRVANAVTEAWSARRPGAVGWGLGHAVVAQNRRSVYADGSAVMYGATNKDDFRMIEGYEDHGVEVLFFWDENENLIATAINVACPAQEVEGLSAVNADFWHEVRQSLQAAHGEDLRVLGWIAPAGDQSPHLMLRKRAEERMRELRGLTRLEELARRIVHAWDEAYDGAKKDIHSDVVLTHRIETLQLPLRPITEAEANEASAEIEKLSADPANLRRVNWHQRVVDRYRQQQDGTAEPRSMELHVVRLGDVAIATNDFELYTDFGIQMKARSRALQTFLIQLAGSGSYVPSERAVKGGGYSAIPASNVVGPEGGQMLTEKTVELINSLWPSE